MPNGFPEGDFRIINQDTDVRLFTYDGGYTREAVDTKSSTTSESGGTLKNIAQDPGLGVGFPGNRYDDLWFINTDKDQWGKPQGNYLVSHLKVLNGWFCLDLIQTVLELPKIAKLLDSKWSGSNLKKILITPLKNFSPEYLSVPDEEPFPNKEVTLDDIKKIVPFLFPEKVWSRPHQELSRLCLVDLIKEVPEEPEEEIPSDNLTEEVIPSDNLTEEVIPYDELGEYDLEMIILQASSRLSSMVSEYVYKWRRAVKLCGRGRQGVPKWQTQDGYIFLEGQPEQVLTVVKNGESYDLILTDRGEPNQTWRFE